MRKKNKIICSILGIFLVAFISLMVISKINPSLMERFGTSEYFVQINTDGKLEPNRDLWAPTALSCALRQPARR